MDEEFMSELAEEASIVLATDNHAFEGSNLNAAEYTYFKAIRDGRFLSPYWLTQAFHVWMIANWIDLTNPLTYELEIEKEDDDGTDLQTGAEQPTDEMAAPLRVGGSELSRGRAVEQDMDEGGVHCSSIPCGDSRAISQERTRGDGASDLAVEEKQ